MEMVVVYMVKLRKVVMGIVKMVMVEIEMMAISYWWW
jgi:hypothetical protein